MRADGTPELGRLGVFLVSEAENSRRRMTEMGQKTRTSLQWSHVRFPRMQTLAVLRCYDQRGDAGTGDLLVILGLHARYADRAHAFILRHDWDGARDCEAGGKVEEGRPLLHPLFPHPRRLPRQGRGAGLAERDFRSGRPSTIQPFEQQRSRSIVDNRDGDLTAATSVQPVFYSPASSLKELDLRALWREGWRRRSFGVQGRSTAY